LSGDHLLLFTIFVNVVSALYNSKLEEGREKKDVSDARQITVHLPAKEEDLSAKQDRRSVK
jgi:hypothetical protein